MLTIHDAADYIIVKTLEGGEKLNLLKLQKLCYYAQAWHLAFEGRTLFPGKFEAWVHGPVSRDLYMRFRDTHSMYSAVELGDVRAEFGGKRLADADTLHIDNVLESYAGLTGTQLEDLTHREDPWIRARGGLPPSARCETEIDEDLMRKFYAARV